MSDDWFLNRVAIGNVLRKHVIASSCWWIPKLLFEFVENKIKVYKT